MGRKVLTKEQDAQILALYKQGMSDYEIAPIIGVRHKTVGKHLRKMGIHRGKGSNSRKGGIAAAIKEHERLVHRFSTIADKFELITSVNSEHNEVRCRRCGTTFNWHSHSWGLDEPCPHCREEVRNQELRIRKQKRDQEREQRKQLEAIKRESEREQRLSVPIVCAECGKTFYSEYETKRYCSETCKHKSRVRRKNKNAKARRGNSKKYKSRMRIPVNSETNDPTINLDSVFEKHNGECCKCHCKTVRTKYYVPNRATVDHIIALANNGTNTWDNVQLLCARCNSDKRDTGQMRLPIAI